MPWHWPFSTHGWRIVPVPPGVQGLSVVWMSRVCLMNSKFNNAFTHVLQHTQHTLTRAHTRKSTESTIVISTRHIGQILIFSFVAQLLHMQTCPQGTQTRDLSSSKQTTQSFESSSSLGSGGGRWGGDSPTAAPATTAQHWHDHGPLPLVTGAAAGAGAGAWLLVPCWP